MKIIICGNYGENNLGDSLILEGLIKSVREITSNPEITVLANNPKDLEESLKSRGYGTIKAENKFPSGIRSFITYLFGGSFWRTRRVVKNADYFILGGGGLFDGTSKKAILIWGIQAWFAYHYKKPVIMYGQSLGEINSKFAKKVVKKMFRKAEFIAVRDESSKQLLKTWIKGKKILVMPDLVFHATEGQREPRAQSQEPLAPRTLLLNLRPCRHIASEFNKTLADFTDVVTAETGLTVELLPFKKGMDEKYQKAIAETSKAKPKLLEYTDDKEKLNEIYSKAKVLIGMRLHSILYAIKTGTPFLAINYNPKVRNILESLNLSEFVIEINDVTPKNLLKKLQTIIEKEVQIREKLTQIAIGEYKKFATIEKHLKEIII